MTTTPRSPREVALAYFAANNALDADAVADLYAEDGEMIVNGVSLRSGVEVIRAHYRRWMSAMDPAATTSTIGPLIADGDLVAVEIVTETHGYRSPMADFFVIRDGKIRKLITYVDPATLPQAMAKGTKATDA